MASIQETLVFKIQASVKDAQKALTDVQKSVSKTESKFKGLQKGLLTVGKVGAGAIGGLAGAMAGASAMGVKYLSTMEQYQTKFTTILGDTKKATKLMDDIKKMASATPFELPQLADASQKLLVYGVAQEKVINTTRTLGDISLGNAQAFETLTDVFGKVSSAGVMMTDDFNRLIDAGFNPFEEITKKTGESMTDFKKRLENGEVSVDELQAAMAAATSEGGKYFEGMEKQSKTLEGRISTLKDTLNATFGEAFAPLFDFITDNVMPAIQTFADKIKEVAELFRDTYDATGSFSESLMVVLDAIGLEGWANFIQKLMDMYEWIKTIPEKLIEWQTPLMAVASLLGAVAIALGLQKAAQLAALAPTAIGVALLNAQAVVSGVCSAANAILGASFMGLSIPIWAVIAALTVIIFTGYLVVKNWDWIKAKAISIWNSVKEFFSNTWQAIKDTAVNVWNSIKEFFVGLWNGIKETASSIWNSIKEFFSNLWSSIKEKCSNAWNSIKEAISTSWSNTVQWVKDKAVDLLNAFLKLPSQMFDIGKNIITGLWDGLKNIWGNITSWVSEKANWIKDKFKGILGIHSPSREFTKIGEFVDEGLVIGLESGEVDINSQVVGMAEGLKSGFNKSFDNSDGGAISNSSNMVINLNGSYMFEDKDSMDYFLNRMALAVQRG